MLSKNKNIEYEILNKLDDKSLVKYCQLNKETKKICEDDYFWLSRIVNRFPYINREILRNYKQRRSWAQYYIEDLRIFLNKAKKNNPNELLIKSSEVGRLDHLIISLKNGASLDYQDIYGWTALIHASWHGKLNIVKYLIKEGADINHQSVHGTTALIVASQECHLNIVKFLVENGANINHRNNDGLTVLMEASRGGHLNIIKYLIKKGANINHRNNRRETALMRARYYGYSEIADFLREKGAE